MSKPTKTTEIEGKKITNAKLEELLTTKSAKKIIYMHIQGQLTLSSKQLDYILSLEHERF
jgi:hypothetical protein|nr:MAG TPA: hypothetical protein [Bacteriophage sp.]